MSTLKERIEHLLRERRWSKAEIARQSGVTRAAVTDWLNGETEVLTVRVAQCLSSKSGYNANWLATGEGRMLVGAFPKALPPVRAWPFKRINPARIARLSSEELAYVEGKLESLIEQVESDTAAKKK
jgi:hypothetical protein